MASTPKSSRFWDRIAERYDNSASETFEAYNATRLAHMRGFLQPDQTVLDFACGTGRLALDVAPHVAEVLGIDLSAGMIARAKLKIADGEAANVRFARIDLFDPDLDGRRFDVVCTFNVLHLLADPRRYLQRLRELLVPDGLLISETPCLSRKPWFMRAALRVVGLTPVRPRARIFTPQKLERLVADQGFEIVEAKLLDADAGDPWLVARNSE